MGASAALAGAEERHGHLYEPRSSRRNIPASSSASSSAPRMMATKYKLTKEMLDEFGYESHKKADRGDPRAAASRTRSFPSRLKARGWFELPRTRRTKASASTFRSKASRGVKLLREGGAITAATSSQICDGASGVPRGQRKGPEGARREAARPPSIT